MKKLPYIRQGQQLTIDILNGIIKAINSSILERKEYDSMMADITRMFNSYQSKVDNFILKYQDVVDNTPGLMDLLQSYSTLASMVNGTYVASIGSVNITAAGFNIQGTMERARFDAEKDRAETYPQYSSLLITEDGGATTLVYNVAPFEDTPTWIDMNAIAGPGPQGPEGRPGPQGADGEPGADGRDGQVASIKGVASSLEACLDLTPAPSPNDAYVVEDGDDVNLYVYIGGDHTLSSSWIALNNIRGPVGPQGEMAEISIQYSNYADGSHASDVYNSHSFMVISEEGKNTRHIIKLAPKLKFEIVKIQESNNITTPYAEHSDQFFEASNETGVTTTITIPTLRTIESASLVGNNLHLQYRGTAGTTDVGRVVFDSAKIIFTNGISGLPATLKEGDVIIDTSDNYKIYNYIGDDFVEQGTLQGPEGPAGPVGASFKLVGNWVTYGNTSTGAVTASAENVGNAYFLPEADGDHQPGLYVSSETPLGDYEWVFVGNSEGPQGATGATGPIGPRGARITAGEEFYYNEVGALQVPNNTGNTYKQNDLYLNTTSWDLFQVTAIGADPSYTISAVKIGNIKGLGVTNITVDSASETLTITYSNGLTEEVDIATIHISSAEYGTAGLIVHKTDSIDPADKGVFVVEQIGTQSNPADPGTFRIWGDADDLQAPSGAGSAGNSTLIPRADHVHPAQTTITGNAGSATRLGTTGTAAASNKLVLGNGQAPPTVGSTAQPIYLNEGVPTAATLPTATTDANGLMSYTDKGKLDGIDQVYDKVIRNQTQFNELINSATWFDAKSVALVGGPFTISKASGIEIPENVKQIHGFNGAKIIITNFAYNETTAKGGLWYDTLPTSNDYSIRDLEVRCTGGYNGFGFVNCINLSNCIGTGTGEGTYGSGRGFYNCNYLSNCTGTSTGKSSHQGFSYCNNLSNCTGTATGTSGYGYGFYYCVNLSNCTGTGTGSDGRGFDNCDYISNCTGTGTGTAANGYGRGFYNCNYLSNCTGTGTGTSGYCFTSIDYAVNCKNGDYTTAMWSGTNKNIDVETCRKSPVTADNTVLNT
jgi:hypothetical protein